MEFLFVLFLFIYTQSSIYVLYSGPRGYLNLDQNVQWKLNSTGILISGLCWYCLVDLFFLMPGYVWLFLALLGFSLFVSVMFLDGFVYGWQRSIRQRWKDVYIHSTLSFHVHFVCQISYLWFLIAWLRVVLVNLDIDSRNNMFIYSILLGSTHPHK
jgi:hypothetical protein